MSWRRFVELLAGLSFESRWVRALVADRRDNGGDQVVHLDGQAAEAYFAQIGG